MAVLISPDGAYLSLSFQGDDYRYHAVWLRDNARDELTRSPVNGQRLITLLDQVAEPVIERAFLRADCLCVFFAGDAVCYEYPMDWLLTHAYDRPVPERAGWIDASHIAWDNTLQGNMPDGDFAEIVADETRLADWLAAVQQYGFARMTNLPDDPEALMQVVRLFGYVRETNYGPFFEVRSEINPVNLAYTNSGLQAHTDNPYRDPVPTLQLLSCIENTTDGGESIVVDGFHVAQVLREENAEHFALLADHCARFSYAGAADVELHSKRPMIELNPDGELISIRFNNRSAAPFTDIPFHKMAAYYRAYRHLARIIERPDNQVMFKLQPNELFIVDNTRVLHSRKGFSGSGTRWLRGCYADKDGLLSTLQVLRQRQSDHTVTGVAA